MMEAISQWRKKYTLALMLYVSGTVLAFYTDATLTQYSVFAGVLLAVFGTADLVDKKVKTR